MGPATAPVTFLMLRILALTLLVLSSLLLPGNLMGASADVPPPAAVPPASTAAPWYRDALLSSLLIQQMVTDATGFRWIATDDGVYRYDGYELVPLPTLVRRGTRLPNQLVHALALDRAGRLWIGGRAGLFRFDPATGQLLAVKLPLAPGEEPTIFRLLCHPRTGYVWVAAGKRAVVVLDPDRPQHPRFPITRAAHDVFYFAPDAGNGVWLSDYFGKHWRLAGDGRVRPTAIPDYWYPVANTQPARFFTNDGLFEQDSGGRMREIKRWPVRLRLIQALPYLTDSTFDVIAGDQWIQLTGLRGANPRATTTPLEFTPGVPGQRINYVLDRDPQGTWWGFSPYFRGCFKRRTAEQVIHPIGQATGKPVPSARAIQRLGDGRLLVSTYEGNFVQARDSPLAPLRPFPLWFERQPTPRPVAITTYAILRLPQPGRVLLADEAWGFRVLDITTGIVGDALGPNPHVSARSLLADRAGRIWGGASPGLYRLDVGRHQLRRYGDAVPGWPIHTLDVVALADDAAHQALWIATNGGLFWHRPADRTLRRFSADARRTRHLPTDAVLAVTAAGPGRAWVGTRDQGLLLVDAERGVIRQLTVADGLPSQAVASVLLDRAGHVWVGTFAGLVCYFPATGQLAVYREAEGFLDAELNRSSALTDADGTLWFGGVGGVHRVVPQQTVPDPAVRAPRLIVTGIGVSAGTTLNVRQLPNGRVPPLTLAAGPNAFVELRLALTDLFAPDQIRYAYRLRAPGGPPLTAWLPTARRLVLRGLAPDDYDVEVRAETAPGQRPTPPLRVPLHVAARWWQLPVVRALAAGLLVAFGYFLYWLQLRRALRQAALRAERALHEAQLRAELAANLHDEVGALLTRVNLLAEVLREQHMATAPELSAAARPDARGNFDRLLINSRAAVQTMRDVVWGIDSRADSVGALLDRMRDHLDQTATVAGVAATFHHTGLTAGAALAPVLRQNVYLIFKEAVTNAVRHGKEVTEIRARLVREASGALVLDITDNGQGPAGGPPGSSGMGLRNMAQRAAALGAELRVGARPDGQPGYSVWVRVP